MKSAFDAQTSSQSVRRAIAAVAALVLAITGTIMAAPTRSDAVLAPTVRVPSSFVLTGSGYGHGIGMSQYGAYQMALSGKSVAQILSHYYTGAKVSYKRVTSSTRVQVYGDSGRVDVFIANGRSKMAGATFTKSHKSSYPDNTTFALKAVSNGRIEIRKGSALLGTLGKGNKLYLAWENTSYYKGSGTVTANIRKAGSTSAATHGTYRYGRFEIRNIGGRINIVNVLKTNTEYLYGLGEMPSLWGKGKGTAALQAQAVAARTYALMNASLKSACDCNVFDDTRSQYFSGYRKESSLGGSYWKTAVNRTVSGSNGKVMTVGGKLVQAYYYSASGGATLNSEDVWMAKLPYLRSVSDPYSLKAPGNSNVRWTARVSQTAVKKLFPTLRNVTSLVVTARYKGGAVKTLRATDSTGKRAYYTGKADNIRTRLGLKSAWITGIKAG